MSAADTYGSSEGLPTYLDLLRRVRMGAAPDVAVRPGGCVAIPTGAVLPDGADAVVMVEYTAETMPGTIEVTRAVAPGAGLVQADEDVRAGVCWSPEVDPLRSSDLGPARRSRGHPLRGARQTEGGHHLYGRRSRAARYSEARSAGQVRDATASALAGLVTDAGGTPGLRRDRRLTNRAP